MLVGRAAQGRPASSGGKQHRLILAEQVEIGYTTTIFGRGVCRTILLQANVSGYGRSRMSEWKLTAQSGRSEKVGSEPGTLSVGSTNDTVAAARGLEIVAPAPDNVVVLTSASTKAEHCTLATLAISSLVRVWFGRCLG